MTDKSYLRACKKTSGWKGSLFSLISAACKDSYKSCSRSVATCILDLHCRGSLALFRDSRSLLLQLLPLLPGVTFLPSDDDFTCKHKFTYFWSSALPTYRIHFEDGLQSSQNDTLDNKLCHQIMFTFSYIVSLNN